MVWAKNIFVKLLFILFWVLLLISFLWMINLKFATPAHSINVFSWDGTFVRSYIKKFEKETGIKVYLNIYGTNEELLAKLKATKGKGYDLVVPSDYVVGTLIKEGLLKKINKKKLNFFSKINPVLLGHSFDSKNDYSIPFEWEIYCIAINKNFINQNDYKNY